MARRSPKDRRTWRFGALGVGVAIIAIMVGAALWPGASHRYTPDQIAQRIGAAYGDAHARVTSALPDQTEGPPFHPMYAMTVSGHFRRGRLHASSLAFSAVADHLYAWFIRASDGRTIVWEDGQWPTSFVEAERTPAP